MPHSESGLGRWVRALAAEPYGAEVTRDGADASRRTASVPAARRPPAYDAPCTGRQPAPYAADFATRLALALGVRSLPPRQLPPASRPSPHWVPGLLTTFALVLTCLTTAAAQGVLPTPWIDRPAPGHDAAQERWSALGTLQLGSGVGDMAFSALDRQQLLAIGKDGIEAWDVSDTARPSQVYRSRVPEMGPVSALGIDSDRRTVFAASTERLLTWMQGSEILPWLQLAPEVRGVKALRKRTESLDIVVRRSRTLTVLQEAATNGSARGDFVTTASFAQATHAARFSPDGNTLALADDLGNVQLWDLTRNYEPTPRGRQLNTGARLPRALAFSADAGLLAVIGKDDVVRLWDITHPDRPRHLGSPVQLPARSVAFSSDPHLVATAGPDGTVSLWRR